MHARGPHPRAASALRVAVLASGRGSNLQALVDARDAGDLAIDIVGVFSDRAEAPVLERARRAGIRATSLAPAGFARRAAFDAALFAAVDHVQPHLIVCAGYMRLISSAAVRRHLGRMINIHPSLLPQYPGLDTHARALADGATEHGASVHFVIPALDAGPVIAQARVPVLPDDDAAALSQRVLAREHALLVRSVALIADGRIDCDGGHVRLDRSPLSAPLQLGADDRLHAAPAA
ncbi:phosphoribosylglycinamide formyltransferase [Chiayiivirga flava]|uniref:Phosphoribosylglycinamide formyltransferase n=1 Tax=Chiayiivirga flava TaxID=659595 RepID=A0A7W8G370_9GAMM|nr:phosphoribosylglycinamide formyltransferase [Chiayiivirga flava]MBB5209450.1 phosphoribosylglycinamide formyltransferase-1 [Chiayiivirga flava]